MFDTVLAQGTVIDGTGRDPYVADVGITGDKIAAIDNDLSAAECRERVVVNGLAVTPGFIDLHTHSDFTLVVDGRAQSQIHQGVTTEVVGQCGHSCAPVCHQDDIAKIAIGYVAGCEGQGWRSFGEYLDRLQQTPLGVNVAAFVGHGAVHRVVMGDALRPPNPDQVDRMAYLVDEALAQGAAGFSTGLEYWPGSQALPEHIVPLCQAAARQDRLYASHVRNRDRFYDLGFGEAIATSRVANTRLQISHIQPKYGAPEHAMEHTLELIEAARRHGADIAFDVIPHDWNHTLVMAILPPWALEGGVTAILTRLADPDQRARIKQTRNPMWLLVADRVWDKIALLNSRQHPELVGENFTEIGKILRLDPFDAVLDLLLAEGEGMHQLLWTSHAFREADIELCLQQSECAVISDTQAAAPDGELAEHLGSLSGYGWAPRFIKHYVKQRRLLPLADAVRRLTSLPAERLRLSDRGRLAPGWRADIAVFNPTEIADAWTVREPRRYPSGVEHVYVNGIAGIKNGQRTGHNSGEVLREI